MIPRRIWQTWKSKDTLPAAFEAWRRTFVDLHPDWECWLWDDADNRDLVVECFPWFTERYDAYPQTICRVDAVRYLFLYRYGGFYADLDTICLRSLEPLRGRGGVVLGQMGPDPAFEHSIPNAVMASTPRHPFWLTVVHLLLECDELTAAPEWLTGPVVLKRAYELTRDDPDAARASAMGIAGKLPAWLRPAESPEPVVLLPSRVLYPLDWSDPFHQEYFRFPLLSGRISVDAESLRNTLEHSLTCSLWTHSWGNWPVPPLLR